MEAHAVLRPRDSDVGRSDTLWAELIQRSRQRCDPWELVAVWIMVPALRASAWRLCRRGRVELADAQSELVAGFLQALRTSDPAGSDLSRRLWRAANSHAWQICRPHRLDYPIGDVDVVKRGASDYSDADDGGRVVHSGVVPSSGRTADAQTEGERLGSLAERTGMRDRTWRPPQAEGSLRYIRLSGPDVRAGFPRMSAGRSQRVVGVRRHPVKTEE